MSVTRVWVPVDGHGERTGSGIDRGLDHTRPGRRGPTTTLAWAGLRREMGRCRVRKTGRELPADRRRVRAKQPRPKAQTSPPPTQNAPLCK